MFTSEDKEIIAMAMDVLGPEMARMSELVGEIDQKLNEGLHGEVTLPDTHFVALHSLVTIFTNRLYETGNLNIDELNAILASLLAQQGVSKNVH